MKKIAILESKRSNEFRVPIHPQHFSQLIQNSKNIYFQDDYGSRFENINESFITHPFKRDTRDKLLKSADLIVLLKPTKSDLEKLKEGATLIGWCHAVQQIDIAKIAVRRKLTLIAMESMYEKLLNLSSPRHLFYENNYITGYEGVSHALSNVPIVYPESSKVAIISYGNVGRGAAAKLSLLGYENVTVFSRRESESIENKLDKVHYQTVTVKGESFYDENGARLNEILKDFDIIINCIKQDPVNPYIFFSIEEIKAVKDKLLIDLSCDNNMGFEFSHETTWENPIILIYKNYYYAVPNIPTIVWESVSEILSDKLTPIVASFSQDKFTEAVSKIIDEATEIKAGKIINSKIIQYQKKQGFYKAPFFL